MTKQVIKQPIMTDIAAVTSPPEGTCSQEDFDHLRKKGFIVDAATHSYINFFKRDTAHANTCLNIRWENNKWSCTLFRSFDTKKRDYDATFSPSYDSLSDLLNKTKDDLSARAELLESVK